MLNCALLFSYPDCSSFHIEKYQDLPTSRAYAVEHFNINGSLFLAFANFQSNTDDNYNTDSFIYKFNDSSGEFSLYQTIGTNGGRDVEYFTISGEHYLAVANYFNGTTNRLNSVLYRWNGTLFVAFQNIATERGKSFDFFEIAKAPFLAISSYNDVSIYKWKRNMFAKFQEIETGVLRESAAFVINNESYIAFALNRPYSVVYKWSGKNFSHLQNLPGAKDLKPFYVNDHAFLVLAIYGLQKSHLFTSGMASSLWSFSLFLLVGQGRGGGIHLSSVVKRFWLWLIRPTRFSHCIGSLRASSLDFEKFQPFGRLT